jgi:hypothetical protein
LADANTDIDILADIEDIDVSNDILYTYILYSWVVTATLELLVTLQPCFGPRQYIALKS